MTVGRRLIAGIFGEDVNGNVRIAHNIIQDPGAVGILLDQCIDTKLNVAITNNQILNICPCPDGIVVLAEGTANLNALVASNVITGGNVGITVVALEDSRVNMRIAGNSITDFFDVGIDIVAAEDAIAAIQVVRNNIGSSAGFLGILADTFDDSVLGMQIFGNTTDLDFELSRFDASIFRLEDTITSNTFLGGSAAIIDPTITLVPFGFHGFPVP